MVPKSAIVAAALISLSAAVPGAAPAPGTAAAAAPDSAASDARAVAVQPGVAQGSSWQWPLEPPARVVEPFRAPADPYSAGHRGIDVATAPGATVTAPTQGTVVFVGRVVDRPVLTLDAGDGVLLSLEPLASGFVLGQAVERGAPLGAVASGGHCDGRCLHLGVRVDGAYVSPMLFFAAVPAAVLLPLR